MSLSIKKLHALDRLQFVSKVGKYLADIQFHNHPKQTLWLSEKQAANLNRSLKFGSYSTASNEVWVVLDIDGSRCRYVWSDCNDAGYENLKNRFEAAGDE